jgi:hypothetical protein
MFDFTAILGAIATAIFGAIAAWIKTYGIPWIQSKTTAQQRQYALLATKTAVYAAEQMFQGDGRGAERFNYVHQRLTDAGIKLDAGAIREMIEAAVAELKLREAWAEGAAREEPRGAGEDVG